MSSQRIRKELQRNDLFTSGVISPSTLSLSLSLSLYAVVRS